MAMQVSLEFGGGQHRRIRSYRYSRWLPRLLLARKVALGLTFRLGSCRWHCMLLAVRLRVEGGWCHSKRSRSCRYSKWLRTLLLMQLVARVILTKSRS